MRLWTLKSIRTLKAQRGLKRINWPDGPFNEWPVNQSIKLRGLIGPAARPMVLSTGDGVIDMDAEAVRNGPTWERVG